MQVVCLSKHLVSTYKTKWHHNPENLEPHAMHNYVKIIIFSEVITRKYFVDYMSICVKYIRYSESSWCEVTHIQ